MTEAAFTGRKNSQEPLMWRWNVTAVTAGTHRLPGLTLVGDFVCVHSKS